MKVIDTEDRLSQGSWFATEDIARRAEAAYLSNPTFFDDPAHIALCNSVEAELKRHALLWNQCYQTARSATRNQPIHTEVKLNRMQFRPGSRRALEKRLVSMGINSNDITYKPATESISIRVK